MKTIQFFDVTMKQKAGQMLSFKEKIELVKLLAKLGVDGIEVSPIRSAKADSLCIKSITDTVTDTVITVPVRPDKASIDEAMKSLVRAAKGRLQIATPVSLVQMEYLLRDKPASVMEKTCEAIRYAVSAGAEVEFVAEDATRAEPDFLYEFLEKAVCAGASFVTVSDLAGTMLPDEIGHFVAAIRSHSETLQKVFLAVEIHNEHALSDASSIEAIKGGADAVKCAIVPQDIASLANLSGILSHRGSDLSVTSRIRTVEMKRIAGKAARYFAAENAGQTPFDGGLRDGEEEQYFTIHDDIEAIEKETARLGYDLSAEDLTHVYEAFRKAAEKKEKVSSREIDAIVATNALQVPPSYVLSDFIINAGNGISATSHIRLMKDGTLRESVALGDGPVDASFLCIEQIVGTHYELDDFQIRAVTEGRTALGEAVVKLRAGGRVYSGRGISTDIIASSISAYINALNKIVFEEDNR